MFRVGQAVWCYWKTANEKEKAYFEAHITEVWDNTAEVSEISSTEVYEISSDGFVENNDIEGEGEISHSYGLVRRSKTYRSKLTYEI